MESGKSQNTHDKPVDHHYHHHVIITFHLLVTIVTIHQRQLGKYFPDEASRLSRLHKVEKSVERRVIKKRRLNTALLVNPVMVSGLIDDVHSLIIGPYPVFNHQLLPFHGFSCR